ncbi:MAG: PAS domain-containing protein, partial [Propionivibrio sp.]|nr:PAS domain-containing protein [Propionivibrio sp.]
MRLWPLKPPSQSMHQALLFGAALGILVPAVVFTSVQMLTRYDDDVETRIRAPMRQYADILAHGLATALWATDAGTVSKLVDAGMENPDVVRIVVVDENNEVVARNQRANADGTPRLRETRGIRFNNETLGQVDIELSVERVSRALWRDLAEIGIALLAQIVVSIGVIWLLFRRRVILPLRALQQGAHQLARGKLDQALPWTRDDEIGELARALDHMRTELAVSIAEREVNAHRLRMSEENLAITLHSIGDAVIAADPFGRITRMNLAAEQMTGWPVDEARGLGLSQVFHVINARTRTRIANPVQEVIQRGTVIGLADNTLLIARDGREIRISDSAAPIRNAAGEIVGAVLVFSDITEKYRMEEALRASEAENKALISAIPDLIFTNDRGGRYLAAHAPGVDQLLAPPEVFLGRRYDEILPPHVADLFQRGAAAAFATHNIAKSTFLANMSHEIRTPLNGIVGMVNILRREGVTPGQAERLKTIDTSAGHLLGIINDILDISKIEAGKLALDNAPVNVCHLLDTVSAIVAERARAKGLRLDIECAEFPATLRGDPVRLQQALLNYAMNAVKFTETGYVILRARLLDKSESEVRVRFEVRDSGIGIAPDALPRLFHPFEQADNSTTRKYGGTGLGLTITRRLAELMGGEVGVDTLPGAGSVFWFTARLQISSDEDESTPEAGGENAELQLVARHQGRRILIVDDEPVNLEIARFLLEQSGLRVDTAADGEDALRRVQETDYALILMD